jgi:hypothetical protein
MSIKSPVKKLIALGMVAGAIVMAAGCGSEAGGGRPGTPAAKAAVGNWVDPSAQLPAAGPSSELAALRRAEAQKRAASNYRPPAGARYSSAELNAIAKEGYSRR